MTQQIVIFGEVVFDRFRNGTDILGGAPFNVAWHLQAFGVAPLLVSRVGTDDLGKRVQQAMADWGMDRSGLQIDETLPTGVVDVDLIGNEPHYTIVHPSAYDAIAASALPAISPDSLFYHGTLALRDPRSASTLQALRDQASASVFIDVNLRQPWWHAANTLYLLAVGKWVKLNEDELKQLVPASGTLDDRIHHLMAKISLEAVILTQGERGAVIITRSGERWQITPPPAASVVDTVGAGDGFSSVILLGLMRGWPWLTALQRAQEFASAIVGLQGATTLDKSFYESFITVWN